MNTLAVISFISAFVIGLAGIVVGHISLTQIKRTGDRGHGLALAGTIIGYVNVAGALLTALLLVLGGVNYALMQATINSSQSESTEQDSTGTESTQSDSKSREDDSTTEEHGTSTPWAGTAHEAFCTALEDYSLQQSDQRAYLDAVLGATDDEALRGLIERELGALDIDMSTLDAEAQAQRWTERNEWSAAQADQSKACREL